MAFWNEPAREREEEALRRERGHAYGGVVDELPQPLFVAAAREVLSRFSVEERVQLVDAMRGQARAKDINYPGLHTLNGLENAETLAGLFGHMRMNVTGLLEQLLSDTPYYERIFRGMDEVAQAPFPHRASSSSP